MDRFQRNEKCFFGWKCILTPKIAKFLKRLIFIWEKATFFFEQLFPVVAPAQIFCPHFTNCILSQFGDGEGGETHAQIFWHIGVQKKWYKLSKLEGGGGCWGNLDKIQKNSYFFFVKPSPRPNTFPFLLFRANIFPFYLFLLNLS